MSGLDAFAQALRDPAAPPPRLAALNGCDPFARFNVHRNNVAVSLVDALCERHPVCVQLVGAEFFRAMARVLCADKSAVLAADVALRRHIRRLHRRV